MNVPANLLQSVRLVSAKPRRIALRGESAVLFAAANLVTLHLVLAGAATVRAQNGAFVRRLREGEYLFVPPGTKHVAGGRASAALPLAPMREDNRTPLYQMGTGSQACLLLSIALEIDRVRLDAVARIIPEIKRQIPDGAPTIFNLPELLSTEGLKRTAMISGGNALLHCAAEALLINAVRSGVEAGPTTDQHSSRAYSVPVAAALRLMYREPERSWTLSAIAAQIGVSRTVFAESFSRQIGTPPIAYLTRIRMQRAETLLREQRHALAEVARLVGYRSETAFNRAFRAHAGLGPGAWRRAMRGQPDRLRANNISGLA